MKKKLDPKILRCIKRAVAHKHRGFFLIIGDRGRDQVVNLHSLLSNARVGPRPSVLWCYKKQLGFSSHQKKRMKQMKKKMSSGNYDPDVDNPFELFISSSQISYCYYKETQRVLGQTFDMLVLQDFQSITPNLLCRTIETVRGGGLVVLLMTTLTSLKQIYSLSMDAHSRYRTETFKEIDPRFNERFILSLGDCENCVIVDDQMNLLPLSKSEDSEEPIDQLIPKSKEKLAQVKQKTKDQQPVGQLVQLCQTHDQALAVLSLVQSIAQKTLNSTVALTAGRGRGKSAALGFSIAASLVFGYSNILVTAPSPQNLKTLFQFILKGMDSFGYLEHTDYQLHRASNQDNDDSLKNAIVRISIYKGHRQTIQYLRPQDCEPKALSQTELLVIDQAAAIPLPIVKRLLGNYLVFLSSTVNGYEGTGRSLSLKLFKTLRSGKVGDLARVRTFKEIEMEEPIRYNENDPIQAWLQRLLCLDSTNPAPLRSALPHTSMTDLYFVNRDTLFSYHSASEIFLKRLISLFVSSHYKNSPDDLQLLSDAPSHAIFVLLGPLQVKSQAGEEESKQAKKAVFPDILCAIQVCFEGQISREVMRKVSKAGGVRPSGDLLPWTISEQFQDQQFGKLSGIRIVRIACHPQAQGKGYGSKALELLQKYYNGELIDPDQLKVDEAETLFGHKNQQTERLGKGGLLNEKIKQKKGLPPILQKLTERKPAYVQYIGTSYGLTEQLFRFWARAGFQPCYLRQTANQITGEHSCVMLKPLKSDQGDLTIEVKNEQGNWVHPFVLEFSRRFQTLLAFSFRNFSSMLACKILSSCTTADIEHSSVNSFKEVFSSYDLRRLESYSKNLVDYHLITDIVPTIARIYFSEHLGKPESELNLSPTQATVLLGMGLQYKQLDSIGKELGVPTHQVQALFNKIIKKVVNLLNAAYQKEIEEEEDKEKEQEVESREEKLLALIEKKGGRVNKSLVEELNEHKEPSSKRELARMLKKRGNK